MKILNKTIAISALTLLLMSSSYALNGPLVTLDCEEVGSNCQWPSVGLLAGYTLIGSNEVLLGTCTSSLIHKDQTKFVMLTAGHCAAQEELLAAYGLPLIGSVSFDPVNDVNDPNIGIRGAVPIYSSGFFSYASDIGNSSHNLNDLDIGLLVFPRNATNNNGATIDDLYPNIQPVKVLGNDTNTTLESILDTFQNAQDLKVTFVGMGSAVIWGSSTGKPVLDETSRGLRNFVSASFSHLKGNDGRIFELYQRVQDGYSIGSGDSGSPTFYTVEGEQVQIGVHSYSNGLWGEAYGVDITPRMISGDYRLDHPDAIKLIDCVRNAVGATFADQVSNIQACMDAIR